MKYLKKFESYDDSETMAKFQIMDSDAELAFCFNGEIIKNPDYIKDLIEKYNKFYLEENPWGGGPPPHGFINYFNVKFYRDEPATRRALYPTISLIIHTYDYGQLIVSFSIQDKTLRAYNSTFIKKENLTDYDKRVIIQMYKFIKEKLHNRTIDEVISYLNLNVENKVDWNWVS